MKGKPWTKRSCEWCKKKYKSYKGQRDRFCCRVCYFLHKQATKKCPDCGKDRCKFHAREKTAKWRKEASKKELKARSMQIAYRQASGKTATLSLTDARDIINNPPICPYCRFTIPWKELSIDHKIPKSRGGSSEINNLVWTDLECNMIKGNLLEAEFMMLMDFMRDHPEIKPHLVTRLKAGGGFIYRRRL